MNRRLQFLNLFGVIALAVLCVVQWLRDSRLNLEVNQLGTTRQNQQQKISRQEEDLYELSDDLARLKDQVKAEHDDLEATRLKLRASENMVAGVSAKRDQLRESVTNWAAAVNERDTLLKEANGRIQSLSEDLNSAIRKYNELTTNYNSVVKDLNECRTNKPPANNP